MNGQKFSHTHLWAVVQVSVVVIIAAASLLFASAAIGQASLDYDLACRSVMGSAGGTMTGGFYGLTGALGMPIVPAKETDVDPTYAVRSELYGVRAGFLPSYPREQSPAAAIAAPEQSFVQRLPVISKFVRIVRGGC